MTDELFERCQQLADAQPTPLALRRMHETLVLACGAALRGTRQGFGNLFSQVDWLCKRNGIAMRDRIDIQQMRRHSNGGTTLSTDDWLYDVRALVRFISVVMKTGIPQPLLERLPATGRERERTAQASLRRLRCVVTGWDDGYINATTDEGPVSIRQTDDSLTAILAEGMQLNLLDCRREGMTVEAGLVVVEPDFLVDISSLAACFQDYGHHPMAYLIGRMKPRPNTQAILLGNFAGTALDALIHQPDFQFADMLRSSFSEQVLQFCTCRGFDGQRFKLDAQQQVDHIREAVDVLFATDYDRSRALLEPSFVCEHLGLQGRVDLMTDDLRLLVEQKSGRNWNLEIHAPLLYKEDHYVQLLLYYGVLRYNFHLSADRADIRLLYSRYAAKAGLLVVNYYQQLFREAISLRNRIVATEIRLGREGFAQLLTGMDASLMLENKQRADFFNRYVRPEVDRVLQPLRQLSAAEQHYVERMLWFVYREQLARKTGVQEGQGGAQADLWNMPLSEKLETGNILMGELLRKTANSVTIAVDTAAVLPNFRRGDAVYLYQAGEQPDVCSHILYKGMLVALTDSEATISLNDAQHNERAFPPATYAVEHAASDIATTSAMRSIHAFATASADRRNLLMGLRPPRREASVQLTKAYSPHYDGILLKARQASDYFLLQGPPGTGKTSQALRFMVEEELAASPKASLLLTAYTNRAVDEICGMLETAQCRYLRIGNEASCEPRFTGRLLAQALADCPKMGDMQRLIADTPVIVGTTSTLLARPFLFALKRFTLCIVDEASQILEPNILGLLCSDSIDRFILIGDHKQLPAVVQQPDDEPRLHSCRRSLFERLMDIEREAGRTAFFDILHRQGRMHPDVAAFPNEHFYHSEQLECVPCPHQLDTSLHYEQPATDRLDEVLKQRRVIFLPDTIAAQEATAEPASDKVNSAEAAIVADLLRRIFRQYGAERFDAARTVGVIVPYRNQIAMIRRRIAQLGIPQLSDVTIDTVERYQGSQRDVIIYSFTVQHPYQLDFLTANCFEEADGRMVDRKLNVAMTRARCQLLMTGHVPVLSRNALFSELIRRYSCTDVTIGHCGAE